MRGFSVKKSRTSRTTVGHSNRESALVGQHPTLVVAPDQRRLIHRRRLEGLSHVGKGIANVAILRPGGAILQDKVVFHRRERPALIIGRRRELLHAGNLAMSIAEPALARRATSCGGQRISIDDSRVPHFFFAAEQTGCDQRIQLAPGLAQQLIANRDLVWKWKRTGE